MKLLSPKEACEAYQLSPDALKKRRQRGTIPAFWNQDLRHWEYEPPDGLDYEALITGWKDALLKGLLNGIRCKENTIERNEHGAQAFWRSLKLEKHIKHISVENIQLAVSECERPGARENIYKSMMGLYRYMVFRGLRPADDLNRFRVFKPKKNKRRRTFITAEQYETMVNFNNNWRKGRREGYRHLTAILLKTLRWTGIRNTELCKLRLKDIDFDTLTMFVWDGKNGKDRALGLDPELAEDLRIYISQHRPEGRTDHLILQFDGRPLNRRVVSERIHDLAARALGRDLTPHGLRRTLITELLVEGHPHALVQKIAGHESVETLQQYDMSDDLAALDILRKRRAAPVVEIKEDSTRKPLFI